MFEKGDSSNRQKMNGCSFQQVIWQNLSRFLSEQRKLLFLIGFILKTAERAQVLLQNGTRDFQNSAPLERSACFSVKITGNFESFQYFIFEINFLKNENLFQKTVVLLFS